MSCDAARGQHLMTAHMESKLSTVDRDLLDDLDRDLLDHLDRDMVDDLDLSLIHI